MATVLKSMKNVLTAYEAEIAVQNKECQQACTAIHQAHAAHLAKTKATYWELTAQAHEEGFTEEDIARYLHSDTDETEYPINA